MATVILSPHLDDAVLSCWQLLTAPDEVAVINVFAGIPAVVQPAWWDRYTGATDSIARARERIEEDRNALALAGRTARNLGLLDEQYRDRDQPLDPPSAEIAAALPTGTETIYAPAAFADHPDHLLTRAAALELRAEGYRVSLYADLPHATVCGWPGWVSRSSAKDMATPMWDRTLAATGIPSGSIIPEVHKLDGAAYAAKLEAVRTYETQIDALAALMHYPLSDRQSLGYEVVWTLPSAKAESASAGARAAPRP